jgi:hypothetical protein
MGPAYAGRLSGGLSPVRIESLQPFGVTKVGSSD